MMTEISAAVQSFRALVEWVEAQTSLKNSDEWNMAVSQMQERLMAIRSVALESQQREAALSKHVGELKKEAMELKDWPRQAQRYRLSAITSRVLVYALKPGMEHGEPPHYVCTHCYDRGEKSILQAAYGPVVGSTIYHCPRCITDIFVFPHPTLVKGTF